MKNTERKDRTSKNVKPVTEEKVKKSSKEDQLMEPKKMERQTENETSKTI